MAGLHLFLYIIVCLFSTMVSEAGREWYVAHRGVDISNCGQRQSPCKTIRYTISLSARADTIFIDGSAGPYSEGSTDYAKINHTLTIAAMDQNWPTIVCSNKTSKLFSVKSGDGSTVELMLHNLTIKNCKPKHGELSTGVIVVHNARLKLDHCQLINNGVVLYHPQTSMLPCNKSEVLIFNSTLTANQMPKPFQAGITIKGCDSLTLIIQNSTLQSSPIRVQSENDMTVTMTNVTLDGVGTRSSSLDVALASVTNHVSLTKVNVTSHSYSHDSPITISANQQSSSKPYVNMKEVAFMDNTNIKSQGGALSLVAHFQHSEPLLMNCAIKDSVFVNNSVNKADGGAIYMVNVAGIHINRCTFKNNSAINGGAMSILQGKAVTVTASVFDGNHAVSEEIVAMTVGGAIAADQSELTISTSNFTDNSASSEGLSIYSDSLKNLSIQTSRFNLTSKPTSACAGLIYANDDNTSNYWRGPTVLLKNNIFNTSRGSWSDRLLNIRGPASMGNNTFACHQGNHVNHSVIEATRGSSYDYTKVVMWCKACPYGHYTLHGNVLDNNFTLGSQQPASKCSPCPAHGTCVYGSIKPHRNYWVHYYGVNNSASLHLCPPHACVHRLLHSHGHTLHMKCSEHRTGPLCSQCLEGHTLSISTGQCIPTEDCMDMNWTYAIMVGFSILYFLAVIAVLKLWKRQLRGVSIKRNEDQVRLQSQTEGQTGDTLLHHPPPLNTRWGLAGLAASANSQPHVEDGPLTSVPAALLVILLFYQVLPLVFYPLSSPSKIHLSVAFSILDVLNLRPLYTAIPNVCPASLPTSVGPTLMSLFPVWMILGGTTALWCLFSLFTRCCPASVDEEWGQYISRGRLWLWSACQYLCAAFCLLLVSSYVPLLKGSLQMIHCVEYGNFSMVFSTADGGPCFQGWQGGVLAYIMVCLAALPIGIEIAVQHIRNLTSKNLLLLGISPLVFSIINGLACGIDHADHSSTYMTLGTSSSDEPAPATILNALLVKPFKRKTMKVLFISLRSWLSVIFARLLVLMCVCILLGHIPAIRSLLVNILILVCLIHHIASAPLNDRCIHILETLSLSLLLAMSFTNIYCAILYELSYETETDAVMSGFLWVFEWMFCVLVFLAVPLFVAVTLMACRGTKHGRRSSGHSTPQQEQRDEDADA